MTLLDILKHREARSIEDIDAASTISVHSRIIRSKEFLRNLYADLYRHMREAADYNGKGLFVEIGSGGGFIKEIMPNIVTSEIVPHRNVDMVFAAESMPFEVGNVCGIFMLNCFHHFSDPAAVLAEFERVLNVGGFIVMIEPSNTSVARFVYRHLHHEDFDPSAGWSTSTSGRLSTANGALPWIVFVRDHELFGQRFPSLKLESVIHHTAISYLVSGGMTWRQMAPSRSYPFVRAVERLLKPFARSLGMFMTLTLTKQKTDR